METNPYAPHKSRADTKIVVAMSGGVDSSVVAAKLKGEGYDVVGITLQLYDHGLALEKKGACCAGQDIYDASKAAETIGIPHYVLNYESLFKESVMDDFAESYLRGETPIPCVRCNQSVKFRDLYKVAKDLNADALATGHYIQRKEGSDGPELHQAIDKTKDQSYFLFATTKEQLEYLHFPLGGNDKTTTRTLAKQYGLEIADKPDSQDICFVPNGNYASVIEKLRPGALDPGKIIHIDGTELGEHDGIINFTIGQRKGLKIAWHEPLYVIKIDPDTHQVIVGPDTALNSQTITIKDINWLGHNTLNKDGQNVTVKLRSTHKGAHATLYPHDNDNRQLVVKLHTPERAITPGQACVIYDNERVLGGGWITRDQTTDFSAL